MKLARRFLLVCGILAAVGSPSLAVEHKLTGENTTIKFVGSKKDGKHEGAFPKLTGSIVMDGDASKAKLNVTIDMTALTSDNPMLTGHLKNADFFEVKKYPEAKFVSTKVEEKDGVYNVTGDLTLHGKTAPITFPVKLTKTDDSATLTSEFKLKRSEWGITYGKGMINEEVDMSFTIKLK